MNFYIQSGYQGVEVSHAMFALSKENIKFSASNKWNNEPIIGSVEFVESFIGHRPPQYYPYFLKQSLNREVRWIETLCELDDEETVFLKPADRHKRFDSLIVHGSAKYEPVYFEWQRGPYWISDVQ